MSISVHGLFNSTSDLYRLRLIAGKEGIVRPVSWMYYTEDVSTLSFMRGGELVITTGLEIGRHNFLNSQEQDAFVIEYLSSLINLISRQNSSGLILNVGKYIQHVPEEIIQLCNRLQFPLITMPWEIHIVDLMQDYGNRIVSDKQRRQSVSQSIYNAVFRLEKFNPEYIENSAFANADKFSVLLMEKPESMSEMSEEEFCRYMEFSFNIKLGILSTEYVFFLHDETVVYVFHSDVHQWLSKIEKTARMNNYFCSSKISLSGVCNRIEDLHSEYGHGELALKLCDEEILVGDYEKLGIYQLLGEVKDRRILEKIYNQTLGELNVFGKDKLNDYLNTLRLYLKTSGKVAKTAAENSTHRNTVNYRIRKICDTLGIDLDDGETRYMIQTALYIQELLQRV